jgi:hypothetical protein
MEKFLAGLLMATFMLAAVTPTSARDTKYLLPIADALETKDAKEKLDGSVKFFSAVKRPRRSSPSSPPM